MFKLTVDQSYVSKVEEADLCCCRLFLSTIDGGWEITAYFHSLPQASTSMGERGSLIPTDTRQCKQLPLVTSPLKSMSSQPLSVQLYLEHPSLSEPNP
ncbi:hypothetical protein RchiOBHm_Chr5g0031421 [Rosa chinensis]|uniref:Uncharacterized protein n=1 Tax=Rosa chinensis TaxID=74649 RepID=A0A2P6QA57_ROSCH|nr:hypothetical protein RchiOBHm_Chr5g0031421 [Rosa chinensis]